MSKRKLEEEAAVPDGGDVTSFETVISLEKPLADYIQLIRAHVQSDKIVSDDELKANFNKISSVTRDIIWQLLFGREKHDEDSKADAAVEADSSVSHIVGNARADSKATQLLKAAELLEEYKCDACFYSPWEYNEWILTLRDELLRRQMFDFWRNAIVKKELGPCWAKDSDLFDDFEDPEPAAFYAHAGCIAPFAKDVADNADQEESDDDDDEAQIQQRSAATTTTADINETSNNVVSTTTSNITNPNAAIATSDIDTDGAVKQLDEAIIGDDNPLIDYQNLMKKFVRCDEICTDEILNNNFNKIGIAARDAIWRLLFTATQPSETDLAKAGELLEEHKGDACFYSPFAYNTWIVTLRDELLKREMLEFWRETVVNLELGPCWAKDSDYFDDNDDPEPLEFYAHGGCKAPFAEDNDTNTEPPATSSAKTDS